MTKLHVYEVKMDVLALILKIIP